MSFTFKQNYHLYSDYQSYFRWNNWAQIYIIKSSTKSHTNFMQKSKISKILKRFKRWHEVFHLDFKNFIDLKDFIKISKFHEDFKDSEDLGKISRVGYLGFYMSLGNFFFRSSSSQDSCNSAQVYIFYVLVSPTLFFTLMVGS